VQTEVIKVWDIAVRIFHWSLVLFFITAYVTGEDEGQIHILAGYGVLGLIVFRVIWGFIGTRYARFWNFICSPKQVLAYSCSLLSGKPIYYIGHNPLGGLIVLALLLSLGLTVWSGLELEASEGRGLFAAKTMIVQSVYADDDEHHSGEGHDNRRGGEEFWEELHEIVANLTLLLIIFHISGVILSSILHRENLVNAMITGIKAKPHI